jgi:hypothetical protein
LANGLPVGAEVVAFLTGPDNQGNVGTVSTALSGDLQVTSAAAVPGPIAGAGLPGLLASLFGLWLLARSRKQRSSFA